MGLAKKKIKIKMAGLIAALCVFFFLKYLPYRQADTKNLTSSSKFSGSCVLT